MAEAILFGIITIGVVALESAMITNGRKGEHATPYVWGPFNGLFALGNFAGAYQDPSTRTRHIVGGLINLTGVAVANIPLMVDKEEGKKDEYNITATVLSPVLLITGAMVGGRANGQPPVVIIVPPPIPNI